jgi:serine/threonine protein phosphatase PrpC
MAETASGKVIMLVVCDGVGGLFGGEIASADVILAFAKWFDSELPQWPQPIAIERVRQRWDEILQERNDKIVAYGNIANARLGTTFTALFVAPDGNYLIGNVGDSRVYRANGVLTAMTKDHTVAAQAVRDGSMTETEAKGSRGRSVLTQCVGAVPDLHPDYFTGFIGEGMLWLLCSDGFRNRISEAEILKGIEPETCADEQALHARLSELIDICKRRGETDNITAVAMKLI